MATPPIPWHQTVEITKLARLGIEGRDTRRVILGTHTGTHCNAASHIARGETTVDQLSLDTLIGPAVVVDFTGVNKGKFVGVPDFRARIGNQWPERLVLRFDWCQYFGELTYYTEHPFLFPEVAEWLIKSGVRLIATDIPQLDNPARSLGSRSEGPITRELLAGGVVLVESLCNLARLTSRDVMLTVLPLKLAGGDGSPARVVASKTRARNWPFKGPMPGGAGQVNAAPAPRSGQPELIEVQSTQTAELGHLVRSEESTTAVTAGSEVTEAQ